jgi:hypothetical protein
MTKCLQCVKVHPSNAPKFGSFGYITPPQQSPHRDCCAYFSLNVNIKEASMQKYRSTLYYLNLMETKIQMLFF